MKAIAVRNIIIMLLVGTTIQFLSSCIFLKTDRKLVIEDRSDFFQSDVESDVITVNKNGSGDYTTINEAVSNAQNNDTILIAGGVYEESIIVPDKRIHLVGIDRRMCIIKYSGLDYYNPPLTISTGSVSNLTLIATDSGTAGQYEAYTVHIDSNFEAGETLTFTNVDFINEVNPCIGAGLRPDFTLTFISCNFRSYDSPAFYCHDWETDDVDSDKSNQNLIVVECSFINDSKYNPTIILQSQELSDKCASATFIGNKVFNKGTGWFFSMVLWDDRTLTNDNYLGSSDWRLSEASCLNSLSTLDYNFFP